MARKDEYEATEYPGIKKRIKDGKYLVVIDLGRQPKLDKKTGEMVLKQCKTQKLFDKLKDAKAYQGENAAIKKNQKVSTSADFEGKLCNMKALMPSWWEPARQATMRQTESGKWARPLPSSPRA